MNILLTNDDGIMGEGFLEFADTLHTRTSHTVCVLVPVENRSGISNALTKYPNKVSIQPYSKDTWICSGTPADCVKIAILGGLPENEGQKSQAFVPDLVISGINASSNLGTDLIWSGTASAARQAAIYKIPGIAISLVDTNEPYYWAQAFDYVITHLEEFVNLWNKDIFLNINIPNTASGPRGTKITFPSYRWYNRILTPCQNDQPEGSLTYMDICTSIETEIETGSDHEAISQNYVSISPVFLYPVVQRESCSGAPAHASTGSRPLPRQQHLFIKLAPDEEKDASKETCK